MANEGEGVFGGGDDEDDASAGEGFFFVVDGTEVEPEDFEPGSKRINEECGCHFVINGVSPESKEGRAKCARFDCEVVASTAPKQVKKTHFIRINLQKREEVDGAATFVPLDKDGQSRLLAFAERLGLITKEDIIGNKKGKIPLHLAPGRQFKAWIKKRNRQRLNETTRKWEDTGEVDYEIPYNDIFQVDHERVKEIPSNPEYLALLISAGLLDQKEDSNGNVAPPTGDDLDDV